MVISVNFSIFLNENGRVKRNIIVNFNFIKTADKFMQNIYKQLYYLFTWHNSE